MGSPSPTSSRRARRIELRRASVPEVRYPDLPITARRDDILAAIRDHQVVIVAGETGSGKSTQLPKLCLELGRGVEGMIGHTQPRRIAARTVAERVAEELGVELGSAVGYTVRFTDRVGDATLVKVMTDGILLAELQRDRMLRRYDTLIIDEAHERSLNIDFILGYLKQLLPRRPDLKVIVTSATIDTERFSRHFDDAPIVEVSGRTYPVELRYRPLVDDDSDSDSDADRDQVQAICDAVEELGQEGRGDILVFVSGEREIRDTAEAIRGMDLRDTEVLPLYARLSAAEQHRVFQAHRGRRVVLATNVAETSLTVPGIRYVVDSGRARVSRYNRRTKVQRLPIEPISQAAANQRAGRCGRVAPGICIRLYSEDDFASRPEFTEPEILRTNLASVILQMAAIGLGDVSAFPFVDPPDSRNVKDGVALLEELGALDPDATDARHRLTPLGRKLAQLPLDPRLGRMVIEADSNGCAREVMVIAAALAIQDPRERPVDKRQAADEKHARFADKESDFLTLLNVWTYLRERQRALSSNQFRKLCRTEYFNYLRVREWQDIYSQLRQMAGSVGVFINTEPGDRNRIHLSLLAGLLSHIGSRDPEKRDYKGARNARFAIAPGSVLFKQGPRWVMAAELVETNRMWGRVAARVQPEWAERVGRHLIKYSYSEPHWDPDRGAAMASERGTLYGLPLVGPRRVAYSRVDPGMARQMFIQHALVEGDWEAHHPFLDHNRKLVDEVQALEDRARRRVLVDGDALFAFYDDRIATTVTSGRHFDSWWKQGRRRHPDLLNFTVEMLVEPEARGLDAQAYPDSWRQGDLTLRLTYEFEPGSEGDGVSVHIPLALLESVRGEGFDWQVPGLREELVTALIRSLPKQVRRNFVPAPDHARAFLARCGPDDGPLLDLLTRHLTRTTGDPIPPGSWNLDAVPDHLRLNFVVEDKQGRPLASSRDLPALKERLRRHTRAAVAKSAPSVERSGLRGWTFGSLPRSVEGASAGHTVHGYPALVDEGESVAIRVFTTEAEQQAAMWDGTRRLLRLTVPSARKPLARLISTATKLALARNPYASVDDLLDDCEVCAVDELLAGHGGPVWDGDDFDALRKHVDAGLLGTLVEVVTGAGRVLEAARAVEQRLDSVSTPALAAAVADMRAQLDDLVHPGFVSTAGAGRLADIERYVRAIDRRLDKAAEDPARDRRRMQRIHQLEAEYDRLAASGVDPQTLADAGWMLQELRVSEFAQSLGTAGAVSEQRVRRALAAIS